MRNRFIQFFLTILLAECLLITLAVGWAEVKESLVLSTIPFRYPTFADIFDYSPPVKPVADSLLQTFITSEEQAGNLDDLSSIQEDTEFQMLYDRGFWGSGVFSFDSILTDTLSLNRVMNPEKNGRYALDAFFEALVTLKENPNNDSLYRIIHYGDSQIEGDRITQFLRGYFQKHFGGYGLGFLPIQELGNHHSYQRKETANWLRYNVFSMRAPNPYYGASGNTFRFQAAVKELSDAAIGGMQRAAVSFVIDPRVRYDHLKVGWGRAPVDCYLNTYLRDSLVAQDTLYAQDTFSLQRITLPPNAHELRLEFMAKSSPDIYGIWLDPVSGIQVDNYALRGHSGNGLLKMSTDFLAKQLSVLNTRLIIVQYGGNVVPYPDVKEFKWFEEDTYRILQKLKAAAPKASIVVVSVADAAYKSGGNLRSYPTVPKIREAQRNAALRANCAFWDLYAVMGGENSMARWVAQGLGSSDYAHMGYRGQKLIGKMLFYALMKEFHVYLGRRMERNVQKVFGNKISNGVLPVGPNLPVDSLVIENPEK